MQGERCGMGGYRRCTRGGIMCRFLCMRNKYQLFASLTFRRPYTQCFPPPRHCTAHQPFRSAKPRTSIPGLCIVNFGSRTHYTVLTSTPISIRACLKIILCQGENHFIMILHEIWYALYSSAGSYYTVGCGPSYLVF